MARSQNNYSANDRSKITSWLIPGTNRKVSLRKGSTGYLLVHFAAWFDKNIESVDGGIYDDWGYAERPVRGSTTTLSNHASGTAIDLNATKHPLGKRNTFTNAEEAKIRAQLRKYNGAIRWGGDYTRRADEMHFEINRNLAAVTAVAAKLKAGTAVKEATTRKVSLSAVRTQFEIGADKRSGRLVKNSDVKAVQKMLNKAKTSKLPEDGIAGARTVRAYKQFEQAAGFDKADGIPSTVGLERLFRRSAIKTTITK